MYCSRMTSKFDDNIDICIYIYICIECIYWIQKGTLGALGFCIFCFFMFFPLFFISTFPHVQKVKENQKEIKKTILWEESGVSLFQIVFFFFVFLVFLEVFWCPKPQPSKNSRKTKKNKKNKKNNPVRRILGKSIQDCFFCFFLVYLFFLEVFAVPSPTVQKLEENQKKTKKPILWEESWVSPFRIVFFVFFGLFGFSRGFCCPKPNCPKTRGKPKKTILWEESWVSPFRIVFFVFLVYLVFLKVFAVPSPTVQKLEATELFMWKRENNIYLYVYV